MPFFSWHQAQRRKFLKGVAWQSKWSLYLSSALRDVGLGVTNVFVPIYLYQLFGRGELVFGFMALYHLTVVISIYSVAKIITKIGLDWAGFIGGWLRVGFFGLLLMGEKNLSFIWMAAVILGLVIGFTWLTHHYYLVASAETQKFGKTVAYLQLIDRWLVNLMPLMGGVILQIGGFKLMYLIAIGFFGLSGWPLFWDRFNKKTMRLAWRQVTDKHWTGSHKRLGLAFVSVGAKNEVLQVVWPIYLYLVVSSYIKVGLIQAAGLVIASVIIVWMGREADLGKRKWLKPAVIINAVNLWWRGFMISGLVLFVFETVYQVVASFIWVLFDSQVYEAAVKERRLEFFVKRKWFLHSGGLIGSLILAAMFWLKVGWPVVFSFGGLSMILFGLVQPVMVKKDEYD